MVIVIFIVLLVVLLGGGLTAVIIVLAGNKRENPAQLPQPNQVAMPHPATPAASPGPEKIVERQVLVQRCPHCHEFTPVDLSACKSCGAKIQSPS